MGMNERIRELMKQSNPSGDFSDCEWVFEKFAELIVRECVQVIENVPPGYSDYRSQIEESMRNFCVVTLKDHFGVEE